MPSANRGRHPPSHAETRKTNHAKPTCRDAFLRLPRDAFLRLPKPPGNAKTRKTNHAKPTCRDAFLRLSQPPGNAKTRKTNHAKPTCRDAFLRLSQPPSLRDRRFYSAISRAETRERVSTTFRRTHGYRAETRERVSTTFRRTHGYTPHSPDDGRRGAPRLYKPDNAETQKTNTQKPL